MNLKGTLLSNGINTKKLKAALLAYQKDIEIPSHYEEPFKFLEAVTIFDIIESFLSLLEDDRENELREGSSQIGKPAKA